MHAGGQDGLYPCRNGVFGHPMFYRAIWKERFKAAQGDAQEAGTSSESTKMRS